MSDIESYDGLCGIIAPFANSNVRLRCKYPIDHSGPCSFEKYKNNFMCGSHCGEDDYIKWLLNKPDEDGVKRGFIESIIYHKK